MNPEAMNALVTWGPAILMVVLLYFLLLRPQKQEQKRRKEMLENLKKGDKVVTIGGLYGRITDLQERIVKLRIADHVEIEMARSAINANITQEDNAQKA
ncbi:MAG: preprotein translocase subunit YajC [Selenomonadaceae bacterium]|nr:preprotein translocase subunit YajC [Selenomonadaceae bacterium]